MATKDFVDYYCPCTGCDQLLFRIENITGKRFDEAAPLNVTQHGRSMICPKCKKEIRMIGSESGPWTPAQQDC